MAPGDASNMPIVEGGDSPHVAFDTDSDAHHYWFVGLQINPASGQLTAGLTRFDNGDPHHVIFDRCYMLGDSTVGGRRALTINGANMAVVDCYITDWWEATADSQAVFWYEGAGPWKIDNNFLEGAGENILVGGVSRAVVDGDLPSDITITRNHFFKPLTWKADDGSYDSTTRSIKNLLELKLGRRVLIEGNVFEHCWAAAQSGRAILLKSTNQGSHANGGPAEVTDVTFRYNKLDGASGFMEFSQEGSPVTDPSRFDIHDNLCLDLLSANWTSADTAYDFVNDMDDVEINHNTIVDNSKMTFTHSGEHTGFVFTNNITDKGSFGFKGTGAAEGTATLDAFHNGDAYTFTANMIIAASSGSYPSGNFFPADDAAVKYVNLAGGDYKLASDSPGFETGTDGNDVGADIATLDTKIAGAISGSWAASATLLPFLK